jgi:hypothetical protein
MVLLVLSVILSALVFIHGRGRRDFFYLKLLKLKGVEYVWSLMVTENKKAWFGGEWMFKC